MPNLRLIKQFINIFVTHQPDELHDILADDFYFKSPRIEIFGKNDYIQYIKNSDVVFTTDMVSLKLGENDTYIREYIVTMYDSKVKLSDEIHVVEHVKINQNLISASIIDYKIDELSVSARKLLKIP